MSEVPLYRCIERTSRTARATLAASPKRSHLSKRSVFHACRNFIDGFFRARKRCWPRERMKQCHEFSCKGYFGGIAKKKPSLKKVRL